MSSTPSDLQWVADPDPRWDDARERVFATVPPTVFPGLARTPGDPLSGAWWAAQADGRSVGYGWLDDAWGDGEILLAVESSTRGTGVGAFVLAHLEREASARGLNYVVNVVRDTHPQRDDVTAWLVAHGFTAAEDGRLRKRVGGRDIGGQEDGAPDAGPAPRPDEGRRSRYEAERAKVAGRGVTGPGDPSAARGPGSEEAGGYVDPEQHRY